MKTKMTREEKIRECIEKYCMLDDTFMRVLLKDKFLTEFFIQKILNKDNLKIIESKSQEDLKNLYGKSVILDILATNSNNAIYNIEIQKANQGAMPKRARYHMSMLDANISDIGQDYSKLPNTYVIFILENDYFKKNKKLYTIVRKFEDSNEIFKDGQKIIYYNTSIIDDTELGKLSHDIRESDPSKMKYKIMREKIGYYKDMNTEGGKEMCRISQKKVTFGKEEGILIGEEIGEKRRAILTAKILLEENTPIELISRATSLSIDEIEKLKN